MKLDTYILENDVTEAELARVAGCSQSAVNKVRNGVGNPTFDLLRRISEATGGMFKPADFEMINPRPFRDCEIPSPKAPPSLPSEAQVSGERR
jgi:transcriptional regulator with XRE-family HTH domain